MFNIIVFKHLIFRAFQGLEHIHFRIKNNQDDACGKETKEKDSFKSMTFEGKLEVARYGRTLF